MYALLESSSADRLASGSPCGALPGKDLAQRRLDELLLQSVAAGDRNAMRVLYQRYHVRVYRFVLRLIRNAALAEDIVSDVFLDVWKDAGRFQGKSSVATWLLAIGRHKAISALRRRSESHLDDQMEETVADTRDNPEVQTVQIDRCEVIQRCLSKLSPAHRQIMDLVYYHEKSVKEVSQVVGVPEGTVKTRMFHARRHMSRLLRAAGIHGVC
jgi:RNA polymerase sigma-70 factor (ECF subfamily)